MQITKNAVAITRFDNKVATAHPDNIHLRQSNDRPKKINQNSNDQK